MTSPNCCGPDYDTLFDERTAKRELDAYRRKGATGTGRRLVEAVRAAGVEAATVLDVGGGVGVIGIELLEAGASRLIDVDAARPYVEAARSEVERRGLADRTQLVHGDFVEVAERIDAADVVTLHRVICCYGDWRALVDSSAQRSRRLYGLVYPVDRWWTRLAVGAQNVVMRMLRSNFRFYIHPERLLDARVREHGLTPVVHERGLIWQTILYSRGGTEAR